MQIVSWGDNSMKCQSLFPGKDMKNMFQTEIFNPARSALKHYSYTVKPRQLEHRWLVYHG